MTLLRWLPLLVLAIPVAQCGGEIADGSDGGAAGVPCGPTQPCPFAERCFFPVSEGCAAEGRCFGGYGGACKGGPACGCDGQTRFALCGPAGYASEPVEHTGPCEDAVEQPTCAGPRASAAISPATRRSRCARPGPRPELARKKKSRRTSARASRRIQRSRVVRLGRTRQTRAAARAS